MTKSRIVSSSHLVAEDAAETSELEYGLFVATNAFNRWIVRCMTASGLPDLGPLDVMVLHTINHRDRPKKLADICFTLNIEDTHTVNYALKKLLKQGVVKADRQRKERLYQASAAGPRRLRTLPRGSRCLSRRNTNGAWHRRYR